MRRAVRREWCRWFIAATALALSSLWVVAPRDAHATPIVFRIFNLGETTAYVVQRNSHTLDTESTSAHGVFDERIDAAHGDQIVLSRNDDLAPPVPPVFDSAIAQNKTCARLTWTPSSDPTVVGYMISYGFFSVELGQAKEYQYSVEVGTQSSYDLCSLGGTMYYLSIQAVNYVGQLSAYSNERTVEMTTSAVLISHFDARATYDTVNLSWELETDEALTGYYLYRSDAGLTERRILASPLPTSTRSYQDTHVRGGMTYTYTLAALREDGSEYRSAPVTAVTPAFALELEPNAPNPFRSQTRIPFTLPSAAHVTVRVYDVRGALVATLFDGTLGEGRHQVGWGGHDLGGNLVASGTYFCRLTAGKHVESQKMLLVK